MNMSKFVPAKSQILAQFDFSHERVEPGIPEGQVDDRTPMDGSVRDSGETPPGQRAFARRSHQLMFKKWSQAKRV